MDIKVNSNTAIVFDLDDTLYNEVEFLKSAFKDIAINIDEHNWPKTYSMMFSLHRSKKNVFDILNKEFKIPKDDLIKIYRNHIPNIKAFPGVFDFLNNIKIKNGFIGIITDGRKITQTNKISSLGIEKFVDALVISEVIGSEKPNINNFEAIQNTFNVDNYLYIADNFRKDFISPKLLGWKTLALIDNGLNIHHNSYQYLKKQYLPDNYFMSYKNLNVV